MNEWQPIDTAPKDGTRILLANPNGIYLGYWNPEFESEWDEINQCSIPVGQWTDDTIRSFSYEELQVLENLTHWMLLPDPPKEHYE